MVGKTLTAIHSLVYGTMITSLVGVTLRRYGISYGMLKGSSSNPLSVGLNTPA